MPKKAICIVSVLCVSTLLFTNATAKVKPDKPDIPDNSAVEWIIFTGDLLGEQEVEGCCPNSGPFPEYSMEFPTDGNLCTEYGYCGTKDGYLFINNYGVGKNHQYIVQFWVEGQFGIEVIGGEVNVDRKTKNVEVNFKNEVCYDLDTEKPLEGVSLTFYLFRIPQ